MGINFVFIDYENVRLEKISLLNRKEFRVVLFASQGQNIPDAEDALKPLGKRASILRIAPGRNSLDFHIAFYLGKISANQPKASFFIVSKDKDYDTLINHMQSLNITTKRVVNVREIFEFPAISEVTGRQKILLVSDIKPSPIEDTPEKQFAKLHHIELMAKDAVTQLKKTTKKPKNLGDLINQVKALLLITTKQDITTAQVYDILIHFMCDQLIYINELTGIITYNLDKQSRFNGNGDLF